MKKLKSISLFFVFGVLSFILGIMAMYLYGRYFTNIIIDYPLEKDSLSENLNFEEASNNYESLCSDTEVIVVAYDIISHDMREETLHLPAKYLGMNRKNFAQAIQQYEISPPLTEREKGFIGIEMLSFSRDKVVLKKTYRQIGPEDGFYLALNHNEVVVLLRDRKTIYLKTGIEIDRMPQDIQNKIMEMYYFENQEDLFSFLENYTS